MRQLLLILISLIGFNAFGQSYVYSFKLEGVIDQNLAKEIKPAISEIFDAKPDFTPATSVFTILSEIEIEEDVFISKMLNHGHDVTSFEIIIIKNDEEDGP